MGGGETRRTQAASRAAFGLRPSLSLFQARLLSSPFLSSSGLSFSLFFSSLLEIEKVAPRPAPSKSVTQGEAGADTPSRPCFSRPVSRRRVLRDMATVLPPSAGGQRSLAAVARLPGPKGGSDYRMRWRVPTPSSRTFEKQFLKFILEIGFLTSSVSGSLYTLFKNCSRSEH